jgi:hypothetical protein
MGKHPLDRIMGFAGIGRPKQDRDTPGAVSQKRSGGRKWNVHWLIGAEEASGICGNVDGLSYPAATARYLPGNPKSIALPLAMGSSNGL